jgi:hypothetical protein
MLFRKRFLDGIRQGAITVAFRRWRRPTVRSGGTLLTAVGLLEIATVERIERGQITQADARRAGYESLEALVTELDARPEGDIFRVGLGRLQADPRIALREASDVRASELDALVAKLRRWDEGADRPWTAHVLSLIAEHPGVRAGDLCVLAGQRKDRFKLNVRKLKAMGLTESLEVGYRISPRGAAVMLALGRQPTRR